jgi:hypothetical protein
VNRVLRDAVVLAAVIAAFAFSLALLVQATGFTSPWFGVVLMLDALGVIAFARPLFLLKLPRFLRELPVSGRRMGLYEALLVPQFGSVLRRTPLRYLNPMVYLGRDADPSRVIAQATSAEAAHYLAIPVLIPYIVHACTRRQWGTVAALVAVEMGSNVYPILHLRLTRLRLRRFHERMSRRALREV